MQQKQIAGGLDLSILTKALAGLTYWRPLAIFALANFVGLACLVLLSAAKSVPLTLLGGLVWLVLSGAGYLGAGHSMVAVVEERSPPAILESLLFGIFTLPRFIGLVIIEFLLILAVLIIEIILLEICRIPALGGLLSLGILPALFLVNVGLVVGVMVMFGLTGPALWFGETVSGALSHLLAVARGRPGATLFLLLLLGILGVLLGALLLAIGGYALSLTATFAGGILNTSSVLLSDLLGVFPWFPGSSLDAMSGWSSGGGAYVLQPSFNDHVYVLSGLLTAATFGILVAAIPNNVMMLGLAYVYQRSVQEVDRSAGDRIIGGVVSKVSEMREKTQQAAASVRKPKPSGEETESPTHAVDTAAAQPGASFCKGCGAKLQEGDQFCGECGRPVS
ncbi:zinc ribbon domain-containing protein [Acidithiobacillus sp. CV18-2]|uniref:Zinc ribbon domain-containing protein n=2 Tax=Igneacidithiobacillus copahuensis TaxID=2724909 RepID=A0AAE3CJA7_9PROT|nr:zinc ribbon domain-containing protein [Acidithiobacillus sp. CV18-3]MBU2756781.1 zinc ribbon domain-containing protein [Acidithiobacillus sp. BN09-2]MBU2778348.1 zinc ribbon domain-containing protein [Acidithiobacillus sp. CV18-2]MBU2787596.1 zinc ribbon domain-containing protein [Igneacidithiobacillus copahuensis]MBU2797619.1 zinc ribbon domain-containing protein [Acidithiobacillus sp. VAN18-2]MBU2797948.1 zinc ribbon domain-containing protein [Acidithiobacillus sp. VAN18-4]